MKPIRKLTTSGIVMAIYIATVFATQGFSFGAYQIRIATALYGLSFIYPFLILPLGMANLLSNFLGGLGIYDIIGGFIVGIITSTVVYLVRRFKLSYWFIAIPIILGPGLIVPIWLSGILGAPYKALAISLCIGQIFPGIVGAVLVGQLKKILPQ